VVAEVAGVYAEFAGYLLAGLPALSWGNLVLGGFVFIDDGGEGFHGALGLRRRLA